MRWIDPATLQNYLGDRAHHSHIAATSEPPETQGYRPILEGHTHAGWEPDPNYHPPPNWPAFRLAMSTDSGWSGWGDSLPRSLHTNLIGAVLVANAEALQLAYDAAQQHTAPTSQAINTWQQLADQHHISVDFGGAS